MSFLSGLARIGGAAGGFLVGGPAGTLAGYSLGSALGGGGHKDSRGDPLTGAAGEYAGYAKQDRNRFLGALEGGQEAVNQSTSAAVQNALPGFMKNLQGSREDAIRRGASNGDLQTSYEGDLMSAFQRNVSNAAAGQAANVYGQQVAGYGNLANGSSNTLLDLLAGNRDAEQAKQNNKYGLVGSLLGAAGNAAGAYYGSRRG